MSPIITGAAILRAASTVSGAKSTADAGDQYTGLDRFGRVVDQRWLKTSDGSHTDRFKHARVAGAKLGIPRPARSSGA